jgi:hypothetical protein
VITLSPTVQLVLIVFGFSSNYLPFFPFSFYLFMLIFALAEQLIGSDHDLHSHSAMDKNTLGDTLPFSAARIRVWKSKATERSSVEEPAALQVPHPKVGLAKQIQEKKNGDAPNAWQPPPKWRVKKA